VREAGQRGSSLGISFVDEGLVSALASAATSETTGLIEEKIDGQEFSCGVLKGKALPGMTSRSLPPQEALVAGIRYQDLCHRILEERLGGRTRPSS